MLKLLKGVGYFCIAYYIIYGDHTNYLQSNSFRIDIATYLVSLNSCETFFLAVISFYLLLSWLIFGFTFWSTVFAVILTTIAGCYYSWQITTDVAQSLGALAYFLISVLGVYSFIAGVFNIWTWNICVENYRPSRPFLLQLINVIATAEDEPESVKEYPYNNIKRVMQYLDAKVGARDNEAGMDFLRGKKD